MLLQKVKGMVIGGREGLGECGGGVGNEEEEEEDYQAVRRWHYFTVRSSS